MGETVYVTVTANQKERWDQEAKDRDMSLSEYTIAMTEAGQKKFDPDPTMDETVNQLRTQRNNLKDENIRLRERVTRLERQLGNGHRELIVKLVRDNPGITFDVLVQRVLKTVPERVSVHIDDLLGEQIQEVDGGYYVPDKEATP